MKIAHMLYPQITSLEHLFQAWHAFKKGKRQKKDVQVFERNLEDNLFRLHEQLRNKTYRHASYTAFNIYDPKFRHIHKATVADRIVHHAIVSLIEPIFDKTFIYDSYSCRLGKGTHRAVKRLISFVRKVSKNYRGNCFALKFDIKKFFESVDHTILLTAIRKRIDDEDLLWLLKHILKSFSPKKGMPIGNLTSQLFANVYLNELDQFVKHRIQVKYYLRYADDFLILSGDKGTLQRSLVPIADFLENSLRLELHPNKIIIRKIDWGVDFLGYIVLPYFILPRTKTKRRIFKKLQDKIRDVQNGTISQASYNQTMASYIGFLKHANTYSFRQDLKNQLWFRAIESAK